MNKTELISHHREAELTLLVAKNDTIMEFKGRGISDLYRLYTTMPEALNGAFLVDKVVGKGAAALMVLGHISELYTAVISKPALQLLTAAGIKVDYSTLVENIINRRGDGVCPVESLCARADSAEACLPLISEFIKSLSRRE